MDLGAKLGIPRPLLYAAAAVSFAISFATFMHYYNASPSDAGASLIGSTRYGSASAVVVEGEITSVALELPDGCGQRTHTVQFGRGYGRLQTAAGSFSGTALSETPGATGTTSRVETRVTGSLGADGHSASGDVVQVTQLVSQGQVVGHCEAESSWSARG